MNVAVANPTDMVLKKIKSLPPLPLVVQKLIKVMENDLSSADEISRVLSSDQALAGKVLKLVNSSFYGLSGQVSTISRAVVILGVSATRNLALGLSVARIMAGSDKGDVQAAFWDHSLAAAAACETLARAYGYPDPEEAFIAGLLHDIGHLVFLLAMPKEFTAMLQEDPDNLLEREKAAFGLTHAQAGQRVLKHWKLPRTLEQAVRFHHTSSVITGTEDPLTSIVALADTLTGVRGHRYAGSMADEDFLKVIAVTGLKVEETGEVLKAVDSRFEATRLFLQIAMDEELVSAPLAETEPLDVVLICTERVKTAWTQQILEFLGHNMVSMKQFFGQVQSGEIPDLVILDPDSVTDEQLAKMKPALELARKSLVFFGKDRDDRVATALGGKFPQLPLGFCRQDLTSRRTS